MNPALQESIFRKVGLITRSPLLLQVENIIRQVADSTISVLITGESGTGKEMIAKAIHEASSRREKPLITVNCGAIPEGIFESEIFGHEKGAFTGADRQRQGMFELADGGTIFLDEVGELPLFMQVKILRILETWTFMRVGGTRTLSVDVRLVAATNRDLGEMVVAGTFRQDLYYRLKAVSIVLPPLRERPEDIPMLAEYFAREFSRKNQRRTPDFSPEALELLKQQYWRGNIRELKNFVETLVLLARDTVIRERDVVQRLQAEGVQNPNLPILVRRDPEVDLEQKLTSMFFYFQGELQTIKKMLSELQQTRETPEPVEGREITRKTVQDLEREHIREVLAEHNWNRKKAARALGIGERTIYRKIKKYGL